MCVCVWWSVCVPGLSLGGPGVAILNAEHGVGAGTATGALLEKMAAVPQRGGHTRQSLLTHAPCLTVVVHLMASPAGRAMPQHLLRPNGEGDDDQAGLLTQMSENKQQTNDIVLFIRTIM